MTITVRQSALNGTYSSPPTISLSQTPVEGNLLVAYCNDRSGVTAYTMQEAGWALAAECYQSPADSTYRKSHATWFKIAGAAESTTITVDHTGGGGPFTIGIVEFEATAGEFDTLTLAASVATGSDVVASSYASGTTASVASTNTLLIGHCYTKVGGDTDKPYSDWSAGSDVLTEFAEYDMGASALDASWSWATSTTSGTHSVTATKDVGSTDAERGGIVSLLVFDLGGATPPPNSGSGSGTLSITGSGSGSAPVVPVASGSGGGIVEITGSGTGSAPTLSPNAGSGSGTVALTGAGVGSAPVAGGGSGTLHLTGSGSGSAPVAGSGSGTLALTGSGTGSTSHAGSGSGLVALTGTGSGSTSHAATGSGTVSVTGTGTGSAPHAGTGSGAVAITGTGAGSTAHTGTGTGLLAITGSGAGNAPTLGTPTGSGSGLLHLTGSGTGSAPIVEGAIGTGSGTIHLLGSGTGATSHHGSGSGLLALTGSGAGRDPAAQTRDIKVIAVGAPTNALTTTSPARKIYGETEPTSALTTSAPGVSWTDTEPNL